MLPFALFVVIGFSVGVPLGLLGLLCKHRRRIKEIAVDDIAAAKENANEPSAIQRIASRLWQTFRNLRQKRSRSPGPSQVGATAGETKCADTIEVAVGVGGSSAGMVSAGAEAKSTDDAVRGAAPASVALDSLDSKGVAVDVISSLDGESKGDAVGESKGNAMEVSTSSTHGETTGESKGDDSSGGEGLMTNPMFRKKSIAEEVAPGLESTWHTSSGSAMLRELGIAHSTVDMDGSTGIEHILGVLYGAYKPECKVTAPPSLNPSHVA